MAKRDWWGLIVALVVVLAVVGLLVVVQLTTSSSLSSQETRLDVAATHTCQRLNVTRATDNQAHLQNYQLYSFLIYRARHEPRKFRRHETRGYRRALRRLEHGQHMATWDPLIDCSASNEATVSINLRPVPFSKRTPPSLALDPANAARVDPLGSVH